MPITYGACVGACYAGEAAVVAFARLCGAVPVLRPLAA